MCIRDSISAKDKTRIFKVIETAIEVYENRQKKISTSALNETILKAIEGYRPPVVRGHPIKIKYITQLPTAVPSFAFFCNFPDDIKQPLSLIHISEPTRQAEISYAVFCL